MAQETRNAYGEKLAELIQTNPNIVVLDADLTKYILKPSYQILVFCN